MYISSVLWHIQGVLTAKSQAQYTGHELVTGGLGRWERLQVDNRAASELVGHGEHIDNFVKFWGLNKRLKLPALAELATTSE